MKIETYKYPHSSFLSVEKDFEIILSAMLKDNRLKNLLYYTDKDALRRPNLTEEQSYELIGKNIKSVPKVYVDKSVLCYIIVNFDNFTPNATNTEFRDNIVSFDIICHFDQWNLEGLKLRPYQIAAEIDTLFKEQKLTNIGQLEFMGANQIVLTDEFAGLSLMYMAIHDGEDKKHALDPVDDKALIDNFNELFNNG